MFGKIGCFIIGYVVGVCHASYTFDEKAIKVFEQTPNQISGVGKSAVKFCKKKADNVKDIISSIDEEIMNEEMAEKESPKEDPPEEDIEKVSGEVI